MCGIIAVVGSPILSADVCYPEIQHTITEAVQDMQQRGPDGSGMFVDDGIGLGMTRLAIVGGPAGQQPIWNEDSTIVVVCNGEIYNYHKLRESLESDNHRFTTTSDVEVIVHLYEQHGVHCMQYLEGIFAFALWDTQTRTLLTARDRMGVKPLYYLVRGNQWIFCSEFRTLSKHTEGALDEQATAAYLAFRFVPAPDTIVRGVHKLGPGEYALVRDGELHVEQYWSPAERLSSAMGKIPLGARTNELRFRLFDAVESQATNEVKPGILLSSGLDSTALLAIHHHIFGTTPDTFTVGFESPGRHVSLNEYSELRAAASVAEQYAARHTEACFSAEQVLDVLPQIVSALDEPIADPTAIPLWFAVRLAKEAGAKVVYSGEGLDELFAGYSVYKQVRWLNALRIIPSAIRHVLLSALEQTPFPGQGLLRRSLYPVSQWYQGVGGAFSPDEVRELLGTPSGTVVSSADVLKYVRNILEPVSQRSTITQLLHFDLRAWLAEDTLVKSDKVSMSQSIELRVPFLNQGVVDFALQLGGGAKMHWRQDKLLVRKSLEGIVPREVLHRRKNGFPIPLTAWMFDHWNDFVRATLLDRNANTRELFSAKTLERLLVPSSQKQQKRAARLLWTLLTFEMWSKTRGQAMPIATPFELVKSHGPHENEVSASLRPMVAP